MRISKKNHAVAISYSQTCHILRQMGYVRLRPRRWPGKQDEEARSTFKKEIHVLRQNQEIDLWFCDETGFEGDPQPRTLLCPKGSRPRLPYFGGHVRSNVIGSVRPRDGKFVSLILPYVDTELFELFLKELQRRVSKRHRNLVIMDNASWHKVKRIQWGCLEPLYLPTYSPDLNPIEQLWRVIKQEFFSNFCTNRHEILDEHLERSLKYFMDQRELVKSICAMTTFD